MMAGFERCLLVAILAGLCGCDQLVIQDTSSLLVPHLQRSEIVGIVAGFGTTFAAMPSPSISFMRWRVDGLQLGVMHRSRVVFGMGSSGETGQRDRGLGGRD